MVIIHHSQLRESIRGLSWSQISAVFIYRVYSQETDRWPSAPLQWMQHTLTARSALKAKSSLSCFLLFSQTCMRSPPIFTQQAVLGVTTVHITGRGQKQSPLNDSPHVIASAILVKAFMLLNPIWGPQWSIVFTVSQMYVS